MSLSPGGSGAGRDGRQKRQPVSRTEIRHPNEEQHLLEYGWAMRIMDHPSPHGPADYRTFGLERNYQVPEFQLYYPLSPGVAVSVLGTAIDLIKAGTRFKDGDTSADVLEGFSVKFVDATVGGKKMLRIILPDKQGRIERGEITGTYALQYEQLHELP
jgi:hypothetical protein